MCIFSHHRRHHIQHHYHPSPPKSHRGRRTGLLAFLSDEHLALAQPAGNGGDERVEFRIVLLLMCASPNLSVYLTINVDSCQNFPVDSCCEPLKVLSQLPLL